MWDAFLNNVVREYLTGEAMRPAGEEAMSPGDLVSRESDPDSGNKVSPSIKTMKLDQAWYAPETARRPAT